MSNYAQNQDATVRKQEAAIQNTNRWSTKQLVTMALMCAIAILLSFVEFPIIPAASFLKLDVALVPSTVVGFAYGPGLGVLVGIVCAVAHATITGNWQADAKRRTFNCTKVRVNGSIAGDTIAQKIEKILKEAQYYEGDANYLQIQVQKNRYMQFHNK